MPTSEPLSKCPLCSEPLPADAVECTKCDWYPGYGEADVAPGNNRDLISALLSFVPGAGHLYKGQITLGTILFGGAIVCIIWSITFFMFFGFMIIPVYWSFCAIHAYFAEDYNLNKPIGSHLPN